MLARLQSLKNHDAARLLFWAVPALVVGLVVARMGMLGGIMGIALPIGVLFVGWLFGNPRVGYTGVILVGFFASGIGRYSDALPWGLLADIFLFVAWLALIFKIRLKKDWKPMQNDVMGIALIWYLFVVFEIVNPESNGVVCWFYAMRAVGFYQLGLFGLTFMLLRTERDFDWFMKVMVGLSLFGTAWGIKQMVLPLDWAEEKFLYVDGHAFTHMLAGVLRVFSFYSDAGQFGASQAMIALVCGIIAMGKVSPGQKIFYGIAAVATFVGFAVSGTRGALAVPAIGAITYLVVSRNFKLLTIGMIAIGGVFYFLKYTKGLQSVEQVRRMRTAMNPEDASFQVRLRNQITFGNYLRTRPIGGGIGAAGFWGSRFAPYKLLARTATDSYYVKVWAETGIVGICLHLYMFGFFVGKGGNVVWHLRDPVLRAKASGLFCGMCGIMMASYGNQVFSQMPTGVIMGIAIPLIFIARDLDDIKNGGRRIEDG